MVHIVPEKPKKVVSVKNGKTWIKQKDADVCSYSLLAIFTVSFAILAPNSMHMSLSFSFGAPTTTNP
jgi:hypothetical protein